MMLQILIVEDEKPIAALIRQALTHDGFACTCVEDGLEAADLLEHNRYDLILLDVMLPGLDGFELMPYIRPLEIPVIFITAKDAVADRVKGLQLGAEDYIVKPFALPELRARVDVVLRRYRKTDMVLHVGDLTVDTVAMQVRRGQTEIALTRTEYNLLLLFARNPRRALFRETIYEQVWGGEYPYGSKAVDIQVQHLRNWAGTRSCRRSTAWATGWRSTHEIPGQDDAVHAWAAVIAVRTGRYAADHDLVCQFG